MMKSKIIELAAAAGATATEFGRWRWRRAIPWRWKVLILQQAISRGVPIAPADLLILRSRNKGKDPPAATPVGGRTSPNNLDGSDHALVRGAARA